MHFIHYLDITFSIVLFYIVKGVNDNINGSEHSGVLELVFFYCIMTREVTESKAFTPRKKRVLCCEDIACLLKLFTKYLIGLGIQLLCALAT